jgi:hypothetical protein
MKIKNNNNNSKIKKIDGNLPVHFLNRISIDKNNQMNLSSSITRHPRSISNNNNKL